MDIPSIRMASELATGSSLNSLSRKGTRLESSPVSFDDELSRSHSAPEDGELRKAFQDFVGQTFFSQMISSMRKTQDAAPYFNGGQAEKIFQGQLDQLLSQELSDASASKISDPMFKLFQLRRQ